MIFSTCWKNPHRVIGNCSWRGKCDGGMPHSRSVDEGLETLLFNILDLTRVWHNSLVLCPEPRKKAHLCFGRNNVSLSWQKPPKLYGNVGWCTHSVLSARTTDPGCGIWYLSQMRGKLVVWREVGENYASSAGGPTFLLRALLLGRVGPGWGYGCQQTPLMPSSHPFVLTIETASLIIYCLKCNRNDAVDFFPISRSSNCEEDDAFCRG